MSDSRRRPCELRVVLPASLDAVETFMAGFRSRAKCICDRTALFTAELLLREALTNAVVHGCSNDAAQKVRCALRWHDGRLLMVVQDDGAGFAWHRAADELSQPHDCSGRGLEIYRHYATHVRFNASGNAVAIMKRFDRSSE